MNLLDAARPTLLFMNARGDHLLNLPAIRALASMFTGRLTLLCRHGAHATYFRGIDFARVFEVDSFCRNLQYFFDAEDAAKKLGETDLFICLNPISGDSSNELLALLGCHHSIGFDETFSESLTIDYSIHSADLAFKVPQVLNPHLEISCYSSPVEFSPECDVFSQSLFDKLPRERRVIAVHLDTKTEKMWTLHAWRELVSTLLDDDPSAYVMNVGLQPIAMRAPRLEDRVISLAALPMASAMAVLSRADLFIGVDSCFLHAADLCRIPGVGLFGPTDSHEFGFRFGPHRHVCGEGSLAEVGVGEVLDAVRSLG
jgi:ADP-heptose:LPS heptosyltransferase